MFSTLLISLISDITEHYLAGLQSTLIKSNCCVLCAFQGQYCVLSNMYPCVISANGMYFSSSEQLYQFQKALFHNAFDVCDRIIMSQNPFECKALTKFLRIKTKWNLKRVQIMLNILKLKLFQNTEVWQFLKRHKNELFVESVKGEYFWSCGLCKREIDHVHPSAWPGKNVMGELWMHLSCLTK